MGRKTVLFGFWLLGFALGFFAYLVRRPFIDFLIRLLPNLSIELVGAFISGIAGSLLMLVAVIMWSYLSR